MKKILFLVFMACLCYSGFAQSNSTENKDRKTEKKMILSLTYLKLEIQLIII